MELTQFSWLIFPLCAVLCMAPLRLLQLTFAAAVFGAAASAVVAGLGLPPGLPPGVLFMFYVVLQYALGVRYPGEREVWRLVEPFMLTVVYAILTAVVMPRLFAGQFEVWPQKVDAQFAFPIALGPNRSNYTQSLYLLSNAAMTLLVGVYLTRTRLDFGKLLTAYFAGAGIVLVICAWQVVSRKSGLWFPESFLYSNPGWVIFISQDLGAVPRTNGPFSEPASLAFYLSGVVYASAWVLLRGHRSRAAAVLLPGSVAAMFVSTSTTGYVVLGAGGAFLLVRGLLGGSSPLSGRIFKYGIPLALIGLVGTLAAAAMDRQFAASLQDVVTETLNKSQGASYDERTSLDADCLGILFPSLFLGAGWGSARSSSLIPGMLANLGAVGVLPLLWFGVKLAWQVRQTRLLTTAPERLMVIDAMSASLVGTLVAACVSAPTISTIDFFLALGVLVGCVARVRMEAGYRPMQWQTAQLA